MWGFWEFVLYFVLSGFLWIRVFVSIRAHVYQSAPLSRPLVSCPGVFGCRIYLLVFSSLFPDYCFCWCPCHVVVCEFSPGVASLLGVLVFVLLFISVHMPCLPLCLIFWGAGGFPFSVHPAYYLACQLPCICVCTAASIRTEKWSQSSHSHHQIILWKFL